MLSKQELMLYGGSDAAALAGLHPKKKPIDIFARVACERFDQEDSDPLWIGTELEDFVRKFGVRRYGWETLGPQKLIGTLRPFIRANLDDVLRIDGNEKVLAEYKTANEWTEGRFGPTETDEFPVEYHCQTQLYFAHRPELERGWLVAFLGGIELRRYPLRRDPEMGEALVAIIERFHVDHVLKGVPPPLGIDDSTARWLRERYPRNNGTMLAATPEVEEIAEQLRVARIAGERAEALEKEARLLLEQVIADADGIVGNGWKISFRAPKASTKTDFEAIVRELGVPQDLVQKHTRIVQPSRRFLPTFPKEK